MLRLDLPERYSKTSVHAPRTVWHTSKNSSFRAGLEPPTAQNAQFSTVFSSFSSFFVRFSMHFIDVRPVSLLSELSSALPEAMVASAAPFGLFCIPDRAGPHCVIVSWSSDEPPVELLGAKTAQELEAAPRNVFHAFSTGLGGFPLVFMGFSLGF